MILINPLIDFFDSSSEFDPHIGSCSMTILIISCSFMDTNYHISFLIFCENGWATCAFISCYIVLYKLLRDIWRNILGIFYYFSLGLEGVLHEDWGVAVVLLISVIHHIGKNSVSAYCEGLFECICIIDC